MLALGTKGGALRVFGAPGVELLGQHEGEELTVLRFILRHSNSKQLLDTIRLDCLRLQLTFFRVLFVPGQGRLVTLTSDNSLHLWQIGNNVTKGSPFQLVTPSIWALPVWGGGV